MAFPVVRRFKRRDWNAHVGDAFLNKRTKKNQSSPAFHPSIFGVAVIGPTAVSSDAVSRRLELHKTTMPSRPRIHELADRFASLQQNGAEAKQRPSSGNDAALLDRLQTVSRRIRSPQLAMASLEDAREALGRERYATEAQAERQRENRHLLHRQQRDALVEEQQSLRRAEARLAERLDERALAVQTAIAHERREREEMEASFAAEIGELTAMLRAERAERERRDTVLSTRHEHTVRSLHATIAREREVRERQTAATVAILDEVLERVRTERRRNGQPRDGRESPLLRLLEEGVGRAREHAAMQHAQPPARSPSSPGADSEGASRSDYDGAW